MKNKLRYMKRCYNLRTYMSLRTNFVYKLRFNKEQIQLTKTNLENRMINNKETVFLYRNGSFVLVDLKKRSFLLKKKRESEKKRRANEQLNKRINEIKNYNKVFLNKNFNNRNNLVLKRRYPVNENRRIPFNNNAKFNNRRGGKRRNFFTGNRRPRRNFRRFIPYRSRNYRRFDLTRNNISLSNNMQANESVISNNRSSFIKDNYVVNNYRNNN